MKKVDLTLDYESRMFMNVTSEENMLKEIYLTLSEKNEHIYEIYIIAIDDKSIGRVYSMKYLRYKFAVGFKTHRFEKNPIEHQLHDSFILNHIIDKNIADLEFIPFKSIDGMTRPNYDLTEREVRIMISTIQWLGSSVGKNFLEENGFVHKNDL